MKKLVMFRMICLNIALLSIVALGAMSSAHAVSPHTQFESGVALEEIRCSVSHVLLESPRGTPACVSESSVNRLVQRGFVLVSYTMFVTQDDLVFEDGYNVAVLTDKQEYKFGEPIRYAIINTGTVWASFGNTAYELKIHDLDGTVIAGAIGVKTPVHLKPGERVGGIWHIGHHGDLPLPGKYLISASAGKSKPFTITHDNPAFYELASVSGHSVVVLTDKQEYKLGETIRYAIVNAGMVGASFETFLDYVILVEDDPGVFVSGKVGPSKISLDPGERIDGIWIPHGFYGDPLPTGMYVINAGKFRSEPFTIIQNRPAVSEPTIVDTYSVTVLTDKQEYDLGEIVKYDIINTGTIHVKFRNVAYEFRVEDLHGDVVASPATWGSSHLRVGGFVNGTWDQTNFAGKSLPAGTYVIITGIGRSESFTITNDTYVAQDEAVSVDEHSVTVFMTRNVFSTYGDIACYLIINTGNTTVPFSDAAYEFSVRDLSGNYIVSPAVEPSTVWLQPGEKVLREWYMTDTPEGTYIITAGRYESEPFTTIPSHDLPPICLY